MAINPDSFADSVWSDEMEAGALALDGIGANRLGSPGSADAFAGSMPREADEVRPERQRPERADGERPWLVTAADEDEDEWEDDDDEDDEFFEDEEDEEDEFFPDDDDFEDEEFEDDEDEA